MKRKSAPTPQLNPYFTIIPDFESTVNENREAAMAALKNVDDIEKKIILASTKTRESFDAMNGADTSANLALTVARDAQQVTFCKLTNICVQ